MDNNHFGGIVLIGTGLLFFGMTWLWVFLAYRKEGPVIWHRASRLGFFIFGWAASLVMTIAGIVLVSQPAAHGRHARIGVERRAS